MSPKLPGLVGLLALLSAVVVPPAAATVHLMQIERVIGGVDGDTSAQAIQLRMRASLQNQLQEARLVVYDAAGLNPVVLAEPGAPVAGSGTGSAILFATPSFADVTDPPAVPDFTMAAIPASYLAAGSLVFEGSPVGGIYWRLSWGGAAYTGGQRGTTFNDLDGRFGPAFPAAMPSQGTGAVRFQGAATALSTTNLADYATDAEATEFRNNQGDVFVVGSPSTSAPLSATRLVVMRPAFPNPFNPRTSIAYELARDGFATLRVFAADGSLVDVLHDGHAAAGTYEAIWNGTDLEGRPVASGVYHVRIRAMGEQVTRKLVLTR